MLFTPLSVTFEKIMLKKAVIIYLLLLAYTFVLVHNLIPHHHHKFSTSKHHHHNDQHHEHEQDHHDTDTDEDEDDDEHASNPLFAYHQHTSADTQIEHVVSLSEDNVLKSKLNTLPLSFFYFHFKPPKIPDEPLGRSYINLKISSFHPSSCSLRAPPFVLS